MTTTASVMEGSCANGEASDERDGPGIQGGGGRGEPVAGTVAPRATRPRAPRSSSAPSGRKFCVEKIDYINYKDVKLLAPFRRGRSSRGGSLLSAPHISRRCRRPSSAPGNWPSCPTSASSWRRAAPSAIGVRMSIEVILKEHVEHLGRRGEVVEVADGYARNYLFPRKLALAVTAENKRQIGANAPAPTPTRPRSGRKPRRSAPASRRSKSPSRAGSVSRRRCMDRSRRATWPRRSPIRASPSIGTPHPTGRPAQDAGRPRGGREAAPRGDSAAACEDRARRRLGRRDLYRRLERGCLPCRIGRCPTISTPRRACSARCLSTTRRSTRR